MPQNRYGFHTGYSPWASDFCPTAAKLVADWLSPDTNTWPWNTISGYNTAIPASITTNAIRATPQRDDMRPRARAFTGDKAGALALRDDFEDIEIEAVGE